MPKRIVDQSENVSLPLTVFGSPTAAVQNFVITNIVKAVGVNILNQVVPNIFSIGTPTVAIEGPAVNNNQCFNINSANDVKQLRLNLKVIDFEENKQILTNAKILFDNIKEADLHVYKAGDIGFTGPMTKSSIVEKFEESMIKMENEAKVTSEARDKILDTWKSGGKPDSYEVKLSKIKSDWDLIKQNVDTSLSKFDASSIFIAIQENMLGTAAFVMSSYSLPLFANVLLSMQETQKELQLNYEENAFTVPNFSDQKAWTEWVVKHSSQIFRGVVSCETTLQALDYFEITTTNEQKLHHLIMMDSGLNLIEDVQRGHATDRYIKTTVRFVKMKVMMYALQSFEKTFEINVSFVYKLILDHYFLQSASTKIKIDGLLMILIIASLRSMYYLKRCIALKLAKSEKDDLLEDDDESDEEYLAIIKKNRDLDEKIKKLLEFRNNGRIYTIFNVAHTRWLDFL